MRRYLEGKLIRRDEYRRLNFFINLVIFQKIDTSECWGNLPWDFIFFLIFACLEG